MGLFNGMGLSVIWDEINCDTIEIVHYFFLPTIYQLELLLTFPLMNR